MRKHKDTTWNTGPKSDGGHWGWEDIKITLLMDLRDELKSMNGHLRRLNNLLDCPQLRAIPIELRKIRTNTTKKTRTNGRKA